MLKAFLKGTDTEVSIGDTVTDSRGEQAVLTHIHRASTLGRSGKVTVDNFGSHYDTVWGLEIRNIIKEGEEA